MKWIGRWKITALLTGIAFLILIPVVTKYGKMFFHNANPVLLLFIAFLLAVVVIIGSGIDRLIWQMLRFYVAKREPIIEFQHPIFGKMIREMGLWSGKIRLADKSVSFSIEGPTVEPSERLLLQLQGILDNFSQIAVETLAFARSKDPTLANAKIVPYSIEILDREHPDAFTLELIADDDDSKVWYVDFMNGKPKHLGVNN